MEGLEDARRCRMCFCVHSPAKPCQIGEQEQTGTAGRAIFPRSLAQLYDRSCSLKGLRSLGTLDFQMVRPMCSTMRDQIPGLWRTRS